MSEHRIRLAGPWRSRQPGLAGSERAERLPTGGVGALNTTEIRLERGFHAPSRLSAEATLHLAVSGAGRFVVRLNGLILQEFSDLPAGVLDGERRYEVQRSGLKSFNELEFAPQASDGEVWRLEGVWLVICETGG